MKTRRKLSEIKKSTKKKRQIKRAKKKKTKMKIHNRIYIKKKIIKQRNYRICRKKLEILMLKRKRRTKLKKNRRHNNQQKVMEMMVGKLWKIKRLRMKLKLLRKQVRMQMLVKARCRKVALIRSQPIKKIRWKMILNRKIKK